MELSEGSSSTIQSRKGEKGGGGGWGGREDGAGSAIYF